MAITNAEFQAWITRINAIRTKHGIATSSLTAPGVGTKLTATKLNTIMNATIGSTWISGTVGSTVSAGTIAFNSKKTEIESKLTTWEAVCVFNSVYSNNRNCTGNNGNFSDFGDRCSNGCSGADWDYYEAAWSNGCGSNWNWCSASDNDWSCFDYSSDKGNCPDCWSHFTSDDSDNSNCSHRSNYSNNSANR